MWNSLRSKDWSIIICVKRLDSLKITVQGMGYKIMSVYECQGFYQNVEISLIINYCKLNKNQVIIYITIIICIAVYLIT